MKDTLGNKIQKSRKLRKMTQEDLAEKLNVTAQAVSKWENDASIPDISILIKLADLFNCSLDELLDRNPEVKVVSKEERKDINKMFLKIHILTDSDKTKVKINIPVALFMTCYESGKDIPMVNDKLKGVNINFAEILELIENGVVGDLVDIETDDGTTVKISVE